MSRQHIFVVNDSPDVLDILRELLQGEGYTVTTTSFVPQTFDQIAALDPALLIIDLVVGEQAGWDLLARIADDARTQQIPVIVVSTNQPTKACWTRSRRTHHAVPSIVSCASPSISMCCLAWSTSCSARPSAERNRGSHASS